MTASSPSNRRRSHAADPDDLWKRLIDGDTAALSRAITLSESRHPDHQAVAFELLDRCADLQRESIRIGVTGLPGSGKSTFIEAFGTRILEERGRLAILAIDPSSPVHHGSILGDRTRMPFLSSHRDVFIRPSPSSGTLGGVTATTQETIMLCEAAGYGTVIIETVGVGQSESSIRQLADIVILLLIAGAGDELQGMKGGVLELADVIAVNKAEADHREAAQRTLQDYQQAFGLKADTDDRQRLSTLCSALTGEGIDAIWAWCRSTLAEMRQDGRFEHRRSSQASEWLLAALRKQLEIEFMTDPAVRESLHLATEEVRLGNRHLSRLASDIVKRFREA
jgi:LAO/AO transport system kinase